MRYRPRRPAFSVAGDVGFILHAPAETFTEAERQTLKERGRRLSDLIAGVEQPASAEESEFRAAMTGGGPPNDIAELWQRYLLVRRTPLTIELVPRTSWFTNVRSAVPQSVWDRLRRACYVSAGHRCEVCGGKGRRHPVEAHEVFDYDDCTGTQRLVRLIALCPACHSVKHMGRSSGNGGLEVTLRHLARVNGWTPSDARLYAETQFEVWARRSNREWHVDLSWLESQGVQIPAPK